MSSKLSQDEALRDRRRRINRGAVPKRGVTRQEPEKKAKSCPETRRYGTGGGETTEELSRNGALRDRRRRKNRGAVPRRGVTGQEAEKKPKICPETRRYGTGAGEKSEELSRDEALRDRRRRKNRGAVPRRGVTGQEAEKKPKICPETRRYETGGGEKTEELSRDEALRDRRRRNNRGAVPKRGVTRQEAEKKPRSCPETTRIGTATRKGSGAVLT